MREEQKRLATELCLMLATHFNRRILQVVTLWSRIGTALATASVKVQDGDMHRFCTLCLETVKAHPGVFAADDTAAGLVTELIGKSPEWRQSFVRYIAGRSYIVVILARAAWEVVKAERAAMWEQHRKEMEAAERALSEMTDAEFLADCPGLSRQDLLDVFAFPRIGFPSVRKTEIESGETGEAKGI